MERLEADSLEELYDEIANLKGRAARDKFDTSWSATERYITFSPLMLVFHEEEIDTARLEQTAEWSRHLTQLQALEAEAARAAQAKVAANQRAAEARERAEFERLSAKFGGRS